MTPQEIQKILEAAQRMCDQQGELFFIAPDKMVAIILKLYEAQARVRDALNE
jgi:tRNA1(Val) A37 N6-methylase TrmN6